MPLAWHRRPRLWFLLTGSAALTVAEVSLERLLEVRPRICAPHEPTDCTPEAATAAALPHQVEILLSRTLRFMPLASLPAETFALRSLPEVTSTPRLRTWVSRLMPSPAKTERALAVVASMP